MKVEKKFIRFPENLKVKAMLTELRVEVTDLTNRLGLSRTWVSQVLNGHHEGAETIELIKQELNTIKHEEAI